MNTAFFIAKRISGSKEGSKRISTPMVNIAIVGIALGLAVMIISVSIITGFKKEIRDKVTGFGAHIQISNFDSNKSFETAPINKNQVSLALLNQVKGINHAQVFITKPGIIKTQDNIQSIVLKGIDKNFKWDFFNENLVAGESFELEDSVKSNKILISETIANLLSLKVGSKFTVYFIEKQRPRMRPFVISGIYKTSIEDFDNNFAIVDMRHLQKINGWTENQVSGYEIIIDDFDNLNAMTDSVFEVAGCNVDNDGSMLKISNIRNEFPHIFDWLEIQDVNVWIILILILIVSSINMASGLLILILDRTNMIGLLKAVGYNNETVRNIFLYQAAILIIKGLAWGNTIGIGIILAQKHFAFFPLDETIYYIDRVPVEFNLWYIALLNIGTLTLVTFVMLLPTLVISKITPARAIKFN